MRDDHYTQCYCIEETSGAAFQERINTVLKTVRNPRIELDRNRSFVAYVFFDISFDIPEDVTEAFTLLEGIHHSCAECPYFIRSEDKRKKWHYCSNKNKRIHEKQPVCEIFYRVYYENNLIEGSKG